MSRVVLQQGQLVLPRRMVTGDLVMEDGVISAIAPHIHVQSGDDVVDARGCVVLPGLVDSQVRFRAYTRKGNEDLHSGSVAAVWGGVTSVLETADAHPDDVHDAQTLSNKLALARDSCMVDYGFWMRGQTSSVEDAVAAEGVIGVRLAIDCSPDNLDSVTRWFAEYPGIVGVHAEDRGRLASRYAMYTEGCDVSLHHRIRDVETALRGTQLALDLAARHGTRMHLLHVSSAEELKLLRAEERSRVTGTVNLPHLVFTADDTADLGTRVQCNPPVRGRHDQDALWAALQEGELAVVASDHCPQGLSAKSVPYPHSASGMPGVEWLLPRMATALQTRGLGWLELARWCSEGPARVFGLDRKGRLEVGFDADVVLVNPTDAREVTDASTRSAADWSPYVGQTLVGWPQSVWSHGRAVLRGGELCPRERGRPLNSNPRKPS